MLLNKHSFTTFNKSSLNKCSFFQFSSNRNFIFTGDFYPKIIEPPIFTYENLIVRQALKINTILKDNSLKENSIENKCTSLPFSFVDSNKWTQDWADPNSTGIRSFRKNIKNNVFSPINTTKRLFLGVMLGHIPLTEIHCRSSIVKSKDGLISHTLASKITDGYPCYSIILPLFHTYINDKPATVSEILDLTGVPYQSRLHCISIGFPLIGDSFIQHPSLKPFILENFSYFDSINNNSLLLHCWRAEFILEKENEYIKKLICLPDTLLPSLGLNSLDIVGSKLLSQEKDSSNIIFPDKSKSKILEHYGFFHNIDPSNINQFITKFTENQNNISYKKNILSSNYNKNSKDEKIKLDSNFTQIQNIKAEKRLNYLQRVHQKFHDNHTPWDN